VTIKPGAKLCGVKPEVALALLVIDGVFKQFGYTLRLTEVTGARHKPKSLHYQGQAVDIGLPPDGQRPAVLAVLRDALGGEFDVVEELDHWHIEWQPK
jgi:hypothetical protein